ncbi:MAG: cphA [Edaphobacter sp.]|nr:cphA [Edaphobacter sp.]
MYPLICRPTVANVFYIGYRLKEAFRVRRSDTRLALEHRSRFYTELWRDAASQLGASVEVLGNDILEIRRGQVSTRVQQNSTAIDRLVDVAVAVNKPLVHRLLAKRHLRTPIYCEFTLNEIAKAAAFVEGSASKCVVKPANGGGGRGVTTGITRTFELMRAAAHAAVYGRDLMVEQHVRGDVYRLLYFDGVLLDAVLRRPSAVIADGKSTVRELIRLENEARLEAGPSLAHALISVDLDVQSTLTNQGLTLSAIPNEGVAVTLKTVINDNSQQDNFTAKHLLCTSIIQDGAAAVAVVGARLAGIDVITPDPHVPLAESGGVILEVNTTPSYHHHYHKRDGSYPVAVHLLPTLLANGVAEQHTTAA